MAGERLKVDGWTIWRDEWFDRGLTGCISCTGNDM